MAARLRLSWRRIAETMLSRPSGKPAAHSRTSPPQWANCGKAALGSLIPVSMLWPGHKLRLPTLNGAMRGGNLISFLPSAPPITAATPQGNNAAGYTLVNVGGLAPPGTATARFVLLTGAFAGPGGGAPFFDDASFELVPEPAGIAIAGIAALCLAACRRRR